MSADDLNKVGLCLTDNKSYDHLREGHDEKSDDCVDNGVFRRANPSRITAGGYEFKSTEYDHDDRDDSNYYRENVDDFLNQIVQLVFAGIIITVATTASQRQAGTLTDIILEALSADYAAGCRSHDHAYHKYRANCRTQRLHRLYS